MRMWKKCFSEQYKLCRCLSSNYFICTPFYIMMVANIYEPDNCVKLRERKIGFVTFDNKDAIFIICPVFSEGCFFFYCVQPLNWTSIFCHQAFFSPIDRRIIVVCECWNIECWCVRVCFLLWLFIVDFNSLLWFHCELYFINRCISVESTLLFKWVGCWASIVMTRSGM